jgi:hypothetical protein
MALKGNYVFKGIEIKDAYISISEIKAFKKNVSIVVFGNNTSYNKSYIMEFKVDIYKDDTKTNVLESIKYSCEHNIKGANVYVQAFNHLKSLDAYKDMIDLI